MYITSCYTFNIVHTFLLKKFYIVLEISYKIGFLINLVLKKGFLHIDMFNF